MIDWQLQVAPALSAKDAQEKRSPGGDVLMRNEARLADDKLARRSLLPMARRPRTHLVSSLDKFRRRAASDDSFILLNFP